MSKRTTVTDITMHAQDHQTDSANGHFALRTTSGRIAKRAFDLVFALPFVLVLLPVLCVVVKLAQLCQSRGPLFFCQTRSGREGREFTIFKFRTMDVPAPGQTDLDENPGNRIYPIGTLLRRSKLDEIPQFINVLLGSMSVVGPRPHHFEDCKTFSSQVSDYAQRGIAKPGITGLAQYTEYRGDFEWNCIESRVSRDLQYIRTWSIALDVKLILNTVGLLLKRIGPGISKRLKRLRRNSGTSEIKLHAPVASTPQQDLPSPAAGAVTEKRAA